MIRRLHPEAGEKAEGKVREKARKKVCKDRRQSRENGCQVIDICQKQSYTERKRTGGRQNEEAAGRKDDREMKIAVTYENGEVFQHFGHCESFKLYETQDGKVTEETVVSAQGSGHGALAGFLQAHGVEALICGGIGMGARMALDDAGIRLYPGVQGTRMKRWRRFCPEA